MRALLALMAFLPLAGPARSDGPPQPRTGQPVQAAAESKATTSAAPNGNGTAAMRVYRDPVTGKLFPAPPDASAPRWDDSLMSVERLPNGVIKLNINGQRNAVFTAHRNADGSLGYDCGADAALPGLTPAPASAAGDAHDK
ncbi:post-PEP-CTERM-1 domain-containing protein [Dokdonella soli]|uniref:Uncharacterized protein n=1 Tax=Dokdonella soli TaxID=529810 RepID=A0ABP3TNR6_9GAMM